MVEVLSPRESAKFIAERSQHVQVVAEGMQNAAKTIYNLMKQLAYSKKTWKEHELHPKVMNEETLNWIFVIDCLNFSFWEPKGKPLFKVRYKDKDFTDYEALCAIVNRALDEDIPLTTPSFYKNLTVEQARQIFRSSTTTEIPLLSKRIEHLQEAGRILHEKYGNSISNLIIESKNNAQLLIMGIVNNFSSFRDEGVFENQPVSFYKRAQIFVADVWACFEGEGYGKFDDIGSLTMFADYRVPQALQFLGIMKYSNELNEKVKRDIELKPGSQDEMEIRGCSIHAVECLRWHIENTLQNDKEYDDLENGNEDDHLENETKNDVKDLEVNSVIIDFYLWDYATFHAEEMVNFPEHRTRGHFY